VDRNVPIEQTMQSLEEYVKSGKIGGIGLSEVSAATIKKASGVTKIAAVEVELSLWSTDILSNGVAKACADNSIPIVAYSPLGRGFLTGEIKKPSDIPEGDLRRTMPRFQGENFAKNLDLVRELSKIAKQKGCTPGQLAVSWVKYMSKEIGTDVIPIPGATTASRVAENARVVTLSSDEANEIDSLLKTFTVSGQRYGTAGMAHAEG